jgi:hypothetical protein
MDLKLNGKVGLNVPSRNSGREQLPKNNPPLIPPYKATVYTLEIACWLP